MTDENYQGHVNPKSKALPNSSETPVNAINASKGQRTSSWPLCVEHLENHIQDGTPSAQGVYEQTISKTSLPVLDPRPALGSNEMSADIMNEIRIVVRQELEAHPRQDHRRPSVDGDDSVVSPSSNNLVDYKERRPSHSGTASKSKSDDGWCPPAKASGGISDHSSTPTPIPTPNLSPSSAFAAPPLPPPSAVADVGPPRPEVRFTGSVPPIRVPIPATTKKAPWALYRRSSSLSGEPVLEWGQLFDGNGYATARCGQVLRGLAKYLIEQFPPRGGLVITPEKLGFLYSQFRIEDEVYPLEDIFYYLPRQGNGNSLSNYYNRISDFFADLDCEYHLVPPSTTDTSLLARSSSTLSVSSVMTASPSSPVFSRSSSYSSLGPNPNPYKPLRSRPRSARPCVPALTPVGFAQFFTTCVLAHPDEEAKRLDRIVRELQLVADISSNNVTVPSTPSTPSTPLSPFPSSHTLTTVTGSGSEKLPRQFLRSLLPVNADLNSRKLLEAAVNDLLYDLRLSSPLGSRSSSHFQMSSSSSSAIQPSEQNRRWSIAYPPTDMSVSTRAPGPHLPPPPVPLPPGSSVNVRVVKSGPPTLPSLPSPLPSSVSSVRFEHPSPNTAAAPGPAYPSALVHRTHRHRHRRGYAPNEVVIQSHKQQQQHSPSTAAATSKSSKPNTHGTRFEIGEEDEEVDTDSDSPATTVTATGDRRGSKHERERERDKDRDRDTHRNRDTHKDRDRNRERDHDRKRDRERNREREGDREKAHDRRPDAGSRRHSDRRRSGTVVALSSPTATSATPRHAASSATQAGGSSSSSAVVVANNNEADHDRGPTWSEVLREQQRQQQQHQTVRVSSGGAPFYDDDDGRTYVP
ncbi:hypothetical protein F5Y19DRAFT_203005 [Xylariaceae sp. FL1651]|nr:hypothetical protein F5Y19DRAFT_203005 [Xylariaceae sp. FL1651]